MIDINRYFDKIYVINLDSDVERLEKITNHLDEIGIWNWERIPAHKVTEMPDNWQWRNFIKSDEKYVLGSIGCRYSHLDVISSAYQNNYQKILILEDDAYFTQLPNNILENNINLLNDWDMLYFGGIIEPQYRNQIVQTHAYALNISLYLDILNMANSSGMEIDNFYAKIIQQMSYNYNQSGKWRIRTIHPWNVVVQDETLDSNIKTNI